MNSDSPIKRRTRFGIVELKKPFPWNVGFLADYVTDSPDFEDEGSRHPTYARGRKFSRTFEERWFGFNVEDTIAVFTRDKNGEFTSYYSPLKPHELVARIEPIKRLDAYIHAHVRSFIDGTPPTVPDYHHYITRDTLSTFAQCCTEAHPHLNLRLQLSKIDNARFSWTKLLKIRHSSFLQAANGNLGPLLTDFQRSRRELYTEKARVIDSLYLLWKHVPYTGSVLDERTTHEFLARRDLEKALRSKAFSDTARSLYRMGNFGLSANDELHSDSKSAAGLYHAHAKTGYFRIGDDTRYRRAVVYHEVLGHGLEYQFAYGLNSLEISRMKREDRRRGRRLSRSSAISMMEEKFGDDIRAIREAFAHTVDILCSDRVRKPVADTRNLFPLPWVINHIDSTRKNPAAALLDFNYSDELHRARGFMPTSERLAINLAIRFGNLLHTLMPTQIAPVPPDAHKQLQARARHHRSTL